MCSIRFIVMVLFYDTRYKRLMGIRVYIFIFLGLSYINTTQAQSLLCSDLFTPSVTHKSYSNWNTNLYQKTLHQVLDRQLLPGREELKNVEVQVGLIQALINRSGLSGKVDLKQLPKKIRLDRDVSAYKAGKIVDNLLSLQKEKMFFVKRWFTIHRKAVSEKHVDNYIKQQLVLYEFLKILKANDLYKENSQLENILQFIKDHQSYRKVLTSILVNYFSIQWFGFPMYLPEFQFLHQVKLSGEDIKKLKTFEHQDRIHMIYQKYRNRVRVDRVLNFPRDAFPAFMTVTLLYYAFNPIVYVPEYITKSTSSEIYQAWMEMYKSENGHYPNVFFNASDRNEWAGLYKKIVEQHSTH